MPNARRHRRAVARGSAVAIIDVSFDLQEIYGLIDFASLTHAPTSDLRSTCAASMLCTNIYRTIT